MFGSINLYLHNSCFNKYIAQTYNTHTDRKIFPPKLTFWVMVACNRFVNELKTKFYSMTIFFLCFAYGRKIKDAFAKYGFVLLFSSVKMPF